MGKIYMSKVLSIAAAEVGYLEKATNAQLDDKTANAGRKNFTKYARDLAAAGYYNGNKNGYEWCTIFVAWCVYMASGKDKARSEAAQCYCGPYGASCTSLAGYYKQKGRFSTAPGIGYQIFFRGSDGDPCHTGIVYNVDNNYVYTIEGNTSGASGVVSNGGGVAKKKYARNYSGIYGYGRIIYDEEIKEEEDMTEAQVNALIDKKLAAYSSTAGTGDAPSAWAKPAAEFCKERKIFNGDGNGNYGWKKAVTREALAQILFNLIPAIEKQCGMPQEQVENVIKEAIAAIPHDELDTDKLFKEFKDKLNIKVSVD